MPETHLGVVSHLKSCVTCKRVPSALWSAFFSRFGFSWVMARRVADLYACWWTSGSSKSAAMWKIVHSCLLWCLWRESNDRCFKDRERTLAQLMSLVFNTLYSWTTAFLAPFVISFHDFLFLFFFSLSTWVFLMYTYVLESAFHFFMIFWLLVPKKKKKGTTKWQTWLTCAYFKLETPRLSRFWRKKFRKK